MSRCLILGCSATKDPSPGLMPAIERYQGPLYRVLRAYRADHPRQMPDVWILSARYGLIAASTPIPDYDQMMTPARAHDLHDQVQDALAVALAGHPDTLIAAGQTYVGALVACRDAVPAVRSALVADGRIGQKNAVLKRWLRCDETHIQGCTP